MTDQFIDDCVAAAADLALAFVGEPEEAMLAQLYQVRTNVEAGLAEAFGADVATLIAESFVATVVRRRREIEVSAGATPRVLN